MDTASGIQIARGRTIGIFQPSAERLAELGGWFEQEYRALLRFAHFVTGDRAAAEDLVQDAFVKIYRAGARLNRDTFMPYARKTVVNLSRSAYRRQAGERRATAEFEEPASDAPDLSTTDEVWRAVLRLSPRQRACIALRYYEDLSEAEIAAALGMSVGSVKKHTDRAMTKLRALLGEGRAA